MTEEEDKQVGYKVAVNIINKHRIATFEDTGEILYFNPELGYYTSANNLITVICGSNPASSRPHILKTVMLTIQAKTFCKRFEEPRGYINLRNGVLNLETLELSPHDPQYPFLGRVEIDYLPTATCPIFESTISDVLLSKDILLLQEWFGYHFIPKQPQKKFMVILGEKNSCKSTIINILSAMIGKSNVVNNRLGEFDDPGTHATISLYGKMANTFADLPEETIRDVGMLKALTGNDYIGARKHYKQKIEFINSAKLSFGCNRLPSLSLRVQEDDAFWDRVLLIQTQKIIEHPDRTLEDKMITTELSGILNWALVGYQRIKNNPFTFTGDNVPEIWEESVVGSNPLEEFILENFIYIPDATVSKNAVHELYEKYCQEHLITWKMTQIKFNIYMKKLGLGYRKTSMRVDDHYENIWLWEGIKSNA